MTTALLHEPVAFATCACSKDIHYAKALIGSIRYFYPEAVIHALLDDDVALADVRQIETVPRLETYRVGQLRQSHGLPLTGLLTKLNLFFIPKLKRVVFADSDSILVGPVESHLNSDADLQMLNAENVNQTVPSSRDVFLRWAIDLDSFADISGQLAPEQLIFAQSSHFAVDCRTFPVGLLEKMLPLMGPAHGASNVLRAGDQGFFNYLVNFPAAWGGRVAYSPVTIQVGHTQHMAGYDEISYVAANRAKPYCFIHYVGFCRRYLRRRHEYSAALRWGTLLYYQRLGTAAFVRDEIHRMRAMLGRGINLGWKRYWEASG